MVLLLMWAIFGPECARVRQIVHYSEKGSLSVCVHTTAQRLQRPRKKDRWIARGFTRFSSFICHL